MDDLELRVDLYALRRLGKVLRANDSKVTAVIVDDVLIDVEPGDTTGRLFGIAFDLGTTTVVATLLDLSTGAPVAVRSMLNPQQPFGADVITRISAVMMDERALEHLGELAHQALDELAAEVCAEGGVEPPRGVRGGHRRQRHDDPHRPRDRPGAARDGAVHHGGAALPRGARRRGGSGRPSPGAGRRLPGLRRLRRRRHHRRPHRLRHGPGLEDAPFHRHRDQLRDRPRQQRAPARHGRPGRTCVRGRRHPLRHEGGGRGDRGRQDDAGRPEPAGDRGCRAARAVRLRARRRRRRARRPRPHRAIGPLRERGGGGPARRPGLRRG